MPRGGGRQPAHGGARQRRLAGAAAVARRGRRGAGRLLRRPGDGQRRRRRAARRGRAGRAAAHHLAGGRGDVPVLSTTPVDGALRTTRASTSATAPGSAGRRAGVLVRRTGSATPTSRSPASSAPAPSRPGDEVVTVPSSREPRRARRQAGRPGVRRAAGLGRRPAGALAGRLRAGPRRGRRRRARVEVDVPTRLLAYWADGWQLRARRVHAAGRHHASSTCRSTTTVELPHEHAARTR